MLRIARLGIVAVAVVLVVSACSVDGMPAPEGTPTPKPALSRIPAVVVGDVVDAETASRLEPPLHAYPMPDGTRVVVHETEPLPSVVQDKINAEITAASAPPGDVNHTMEFDLASGTIARKMMLDLRAYAGKSLIAVRTAGIDLTGNGFVWMYMVHVNNTNGKVFDTRDEAQAYIDSFLAQSRNPGNYAVAWPVY